MKEIHQALISLGPLIATTVFSLRAKEKEVPCPMENQDAERGSSHNCFPSFPFHNSDVCLSKEEKPVSIFIDHRGLEVGESSADPNAGHEVVAFRLKDEEGAYGLDHHDTERIETISSAKGDGTMNRKHNLGESVNRIGKATPSKAISGKAKEKMVHSDEKGTYSRSQLWSDNLELGGEDPTQCESGFSAADLTCYQEIPKVQRSETCDDWGRNLCNENLLACQPSVQKNVIAYSCSECKRTFKQKEYFIRHKKTHMGVRPYQCTECGKSFRKNDNLVVHKRTHTGEKPYHCTVCEKSFSQRGDLSRHHLTHTGVRPYQCTFCLKSFTQKGALNRHKRIHKSITL